MRLKRILLPAALGLLLLPLAGSAITNQQFEGIKQLGRLNATALNCGFTDEAHRMKRALIRALPKRRQLGDLFEAVTHEAFLAEMKSNKRCPEAQAFSHQVGEGIKALDRAFIKR